MIVPDLPGRAGTRGCASECRCTWTDQAKISVYETRLVAAR